MGTILVCPKSKKHKRFHRGVHVAMTIVVDENCDYIKDVKGSDCLADEDTWGYSSCAICGTTAEEIND